MKTFSLLLIFTLICLALTAENICSQERRSAVLLLEHEKPNAFNELLEQGFRKGCRQYDFDCHIDIAKEGPAQNQKFGEIARNSNLVLIASDSLHETLRNNAAKFRRVKFGSIDAGIRAANIMSATFADEQASFLAGYAAAMLAEAQSGQEAVLGWLSGENTPAMRSLYNGFAEGAKLCKPDIKIVQALVGSFDDIDNSKIKARSLAAQGARVIVLAAGAGNGPAAAGLSAENIWLISLDDKLESPHVLGWLVRRADKAIYDIISSAAGNFRAKEIDIHNLADAYVNFELTPNLAKINKNLFDNIKRRVEELRKEFIAKAIRVPSLRARTLCDCLD